MSSHFVDTAIPTSARGKVRAFIKSRKEWPAFVEKGGFDSRTVRNRDLLVFASMHGYEGDVLSIIQGAQPVRFPPASDAVMEAFQAKVEKESFLAVADSRDEMLDLRSTSSAMQEPAKKTAAEIEAEIDAAIAEGQAEADAEEEASFQVMLDPAEVAPAVAADILASVDQFLSPFVRAEIEKALQPLIDLANKPAQIVEKIIEVPAPLVAPAGELPFASRSGKAALGNLFGFTGEGADTEVTLWDSCGAAPAEDPFYVCEPVNMRLLATACERGTNVWLVGPGGSGKTSMPKELAARTGRPYTKISFSKNSHADDMIGGKGLEGGNTTWEDGTLIAAMKRPGMMIAFDEITLAPAGVQGILQGITDSHRTYFLPNGEKVVAAPGVCFVICDNTAGNGDDSGLYHGTNPANAALVDRFPRMVRVDYIPAELEARALANHTGAPLDACRYMADFIARARRMPEMENVVLSLRGMIGFIQTVQDGFSCKTAAEVAILNRLPATERASLEVLFTLAWQQGFTNLLKPVQQPAQRPAQQSVNPSGSRAAKAFDDEVSASLAR